MHQQLINNISIIKKAATSLLLIAAIVSNCYAQSLTGTWRGEQQSGGRRFDVTLFLRRIGGGYIGMYNMEEISNVQQAPLNLNLNLNSLLRSAINPRQNNSRLIVHNSQFIAKYENGHLNTLPLGVIYSENAGGLQLMSVTFNHYQSRGSERLEFQQSGNSVSLRKVSSDYAEDAEPYLRRLTSVTDIGYRGNGGESVINYNEKGTLNFILKNQSDYNLGSLSLSIRTEETNSGILSASIERNSFALNKGETVRVQAKVVSSFIIPKDSVSFIVEGTYNGIPVVYKRFSLAARSFFEQKRTVINETSNATLIALSGYYGFNNTSYSSVSAQLGAVAQSGNKLVGLWQAYLQQTGKGGYDKNESNASVLAKKAYPGVMSEAKRGDAEAQYLMFYAIGMGLAGDLPRSVAGEFLKKSAEANYLPAMYDYALYLMKDSMYKESLRYLNRCYDAGMQKAASTIAQCYINGLGVRKDSRMAVDWFERAEKFGDPDTYYQMARFYSIDHDDLPADSKKALQYATKAADLKSTLALSFLGNVYLNGRLGVAKNAAKATSYFKTAATLGDIEAMTTLAYLYLFGIEGTFKKDVAAGIVWTKKGAENGSPNCMALLADLYSNGKIDGKKDIIKARFWGNQARINGVGEADNAAYDASMTNVVNFISNIDFSDQYTYYKDRNTGDIYRSNDGPDIFGGLLSGFLGAYKESRANQQAVINGLKFIYKTGNKKIYGGTITSKINSEIYLLAGQKVIINAYGSVSLGMMAGVAGPGGTYGFSSYSLDASQPHGAVLVGMNNVWTLAGNERVYIAPKDGRLQFAVNDADYSNNKGYFDIVVVVAE